MIKLSDEFVCVRAHDQEAKALFNEAAIAYIDEKSFSLPLYRFADPGGKRMKEFDVNTTLGADQLIEQMSIILKKTGKGVNLSQYEAASEHAREAAEKIEDLDFAAASGLLKKVASLKSDARIVVEARKSREELTKRAEGDFQKAKDLLGEGKRREAAWILQYLKPFGEASQSKEAAAELAKLSADKTFAGEIKQLEEQLRAFRMMNEARRLEKEGAKEKARKAYDAVATQYKGTEYAEEAARKAAELRK